MGVELHWLADESASCFHVVECLIRRQPEVEERFAESMAAASAGLADEVGPDRRDQLRYLSHLVPLASSIGSNRQLATVSLTKTFGRARAELIVSQVAAYIDRLEEAFDRAVPDLGERLSQDSRPLRSAWQTHGDLLMAAVARLTEPEVVVERAEVILVYPAVGGAGQAHLPYNSTRIEAVAVDPLPELPEVVRLAWLLSQLNADLPTYQGEIHRDRLVDVASLAMIPVVLTAAKELAVIRGDQESLKQAVAAWPLDVDQPAAVAEALESWWQTYLDRRPRWTIALAALDQMLG